MLGMSPSYGLPGKARAPRHQPLLVRDHHGVLDPEFARLARLAFADALHLRRVQRVQRVLVMALLRADELAP